jgi:transcriptional regulator with XRE-family HTH domain
MKTPGQRMIKARKKIGWSQERLAKYFGFKSKGTIANYENDLRYPPEGVFKWLKKIEGLTKKEAQEWAKKEAVKA